MERMFGLDAQFLQDALILAINIFILFVAGSYLLFNPARDFLEKRKNGIKADLEKASEDKKDAEALKAEYEEKLKNANKDAEAILAEARKKALDRESQIVSEAKAEAARIIERANVEAELEKKRVKDDVKKEIISVAALMAQRVVGAAVDINVQDNLLEETLKEMGDDTWLS
ncbi:MAG: F0F1 ATP synthase subunit B [Lachnospira sp.]|nr:F0F1 ATP synthase subunit B [Lachnospira sp.]